MIPQELLYGVASQTLYFDPPEGQASGTPTVAVYVATNDDDGATESATTGSCSVDSVSTTFSASLGAQSITVASGTGIARGRRYLLADTDGEREWVECTSISGTTVGIRQPLKLDYASGSTLKGCRISISVLDSWAATKSKISDVLYADERAWRTDVVGDTRVAGATGYRARWSYTVGGVPAIGVSFFDLVRYQAKNLVTPLDVDRRFPGWLDRLPTDYQRDQGQALIDEAFQSVKMDAFGDNQVVRRIRDTQVLRELVVFRANLIAQEASLFHGGSNAEMVKAAQDLYGARYDMLIREPKVPVDQTGGGASAQANRLPAWRR